ncbi:ATPase AAA [Moritella dasanensis]|uniref:ATPase AAA n=1 Tax=Moritella dasanensis TaxID=428031 RepID=UPI00031BC4B9|nr:ATPase AAA [Moritella dasanensis]
MTDQSINGLQENAPKLNTYDSQLFPEIVSEQQIDCTSEHLAKRPTTISETGLSSQLLTELLIKHIHAMHVATIRELADALALPGGIVQVLIDVAKESALIENRQSLASGQMRYALSNIGEVEAEKALKSSGYISVAPVPLTQYVDIVLKQTSRNTQITKQRMQARFAELMFSEALTSAIGPALNSNKPILIYGMPGVGKSYLCRNLNLLFGDDVLIPSAIEISGNIIQVYDPQVHILSTEQNNETPADALFSLDRGHDPRWRLCQRPLIVTGGELTEDMLEVNFDSSSRTYKAPLQLKANNGILLLDDLGRQKMTPLALFNRWIIPLEERRDFLFLPNGVHFEIPFELILLFSTNLNPAELVDEAFLRRLGYKIEFQPLEVDSYKKLWGNVCESFNLTCADDTFDYLLNAYHNTTNKPFLPCYPRDLLSIISDQVKFNELPNKVEKNLIDIAWKHYFVSQS